MAGWVTLWLGGVAVSAIGATYAARAWIDSPWLAAAATALVLTPLVAWSGTLVTRRWSRMASALCDGILSIKDRDFSRTEFARRRLLELDGTSVYVASPEDVLLAKLEWAKLGASARQVEDAAGILRLQGENLDVPYVERWVAVLEIQDQWTEAKARAV